MIYLDHSATTPLVPDARKAVSAAMDSFGNPSSIHKMGLDAAALVRSARNSLYAALNVPTFAAVDSALPIGAGKPDGQRIFFTSCGSESDNLAIFGTLRAKRFSSPPRIITTDSEHPAMASALADLSKRGKIDLVLLSTSGGKIDLAELEENLTPNTLLVSIMAVNNETGAAYDLASAFALVKRKVPGAITHTDAVQGFLKLPIRWNRVGADLITISGHKIGAPKGIGALLVANRLLRAKQIVPLIYGGGQEGGLRSGTENVMGIVGFGAAAAYGKQILPDFVSQMTALREVFISRLPSDVNVHCAPTQASHIISLTLPGIRSETMVRYLSDRGVCISNGSACSSHGPHGNPVLENFGLTKEEADTTVRISMGFENTEEELCTAANLIAKGCSELIPTRQKLSNGPGRAREMGR